MISSVVHWLFKSILFSVYISELSTFPSAVDFWFPSLVRQMDALRDFSPCKLY